MFWLNSGIFLRKRRKCLLGTWQQPPPPWWYTQYRTVHIMVEVSVAALVYVIFFLGHGVQIRAGKHG